MGYLVFIKSGGLPHTPGPQPITAPAEQSPTLAYSVASFGYGAGTGVARTGTTPTEQSPTLGYSISSINYA